MSGPVSIALKEAVAAGESADLARIAKRHGIGEHLLRQRIARLSTARRWIEQNVESKPEAKPEIVAPKIIGNKKHQSVIRFDVNGIALKFFRQEFYRGELKLWFRRGNEQCACGRDIVSHAVPVISDSRSPQLLCECGASYEAVQREIK